MAALVLLGSLVPARDADKVLVPGDPPLTQEMVNRYQERWQWYCDLQLSEQQRKDHRRLFIAFWQTKVNKPITRQLLEEYQQDQQRHSEVPRFKGEEQA